MAHLTLRFLGSFDVQRDGKAVTRFASNKARALLAYLVVEAERPHTRQALAGLLWPDYPEASARHSLRTALANVRRVIGDRAANPPYLHITRQAIQFNPDNDAWCDVTAFAGLISTPSSSADRGERLRPLEDAVELYRGGFLEGFSVSDSVAFEDWALIKRERLQRQVLEALQRLTEHYAQQGANERALRFAQRQVELDPWQESAQRQLMALYAQLGRWGAALRQYRACVRELEQELGVPPAAETTALYEKIRAQRAEQTARDLPEVAPAPSRGRLPAFLRGDAESDRVQRPVFVARERELAALAGHLEAALAGRGKVVFVSGGPGRGKSALIGEFTRWAVGAQPGLLVASGACNAYSGVGDPYLPFREVLEMLTGDVEARWEAGAVSGAHARRLWEAVPLVSRALLDHGPFLIDTLLPGPALLARARSCARADDGWLDELRVWVEREKGAHSDLEQSALFTQLTNQLAALSEAHPLLLTLDDLQWADAGSIGLLFHLGRRLGDARVLIVGAYRPEEVATTRAGEPHRLQELLTEFRRQFGEVTLDLTQADATEGGRFVDLFLDTMPHRLSVDFRDALYRHTGGHPLFTIELLRAMQERGELVQNKQGLWIESQTLDWRTLPARVEAVIEKRVERLDSDLRDMLAAASVEGERFTAQVVAQVQGVSERSVLRALAQELGARHRLVREGGEIQIDGRFLSRYQFAHALFQAYVYDTLSPGERRLLHDEVGAAMEALYAARTDKIAAQLAHHFAQAGRRDRAITYALRAGHKAREAHANDEASGHYRRVLDWLGPPTTSDEQATARRLEAQEGLGQVLFGSGQIPEAEAHFRKAIALGRALKRTPREQVRLHYWLGEALWWRRQYAAMIQVAQDGLASLGDDFESVEAVLMVGHLSAAHRFSGDPSKAGEYTRQLLPLLERLPYVPELRPAFVHAWQMYFIDFKDRQEAIRWVQALAERAAPTQDLRALAASQWLLAHTSGRSGDFQEAITQFQQALTLFETIGDAKHAVWCLGFLTELFLELGDLVTSEALLSKWLEAAQAIGLERDLASAYGYRGVLFLCLGELEQAEDALQQAIELCRDETLRVPEMLAAYHLGRVYLARGDLERAIAFLQNAAVLVPYVSPAELSNHTTLDSSINLARVLSGLEEAYSDPLAFRAFFHHFREEHPQARDSVLVNWYLEPAESPHKLNLRMVEGERGEEAFHNLESEIRSGEWVWENPCGDCAYVVQNGLEIHAANGRDLWNINLSAPHLLRPAPQETDFAVQTVCGFAVPDRPAIGGLLLWRDEENYLRLDRGTRGPREISFQGCIGNQDLVIGRGQLQMGKWANGQMGKSAERVFLRLERVGERVHALCSADGESWFTVGHVEFPVEGPLQIGLHASGNIDRTVYHGVYPDGTAIRFDSFTMWSSDR